MRNRAFACSLSSEVLCADMGWTRGRTHSHGLLTGSSQSLEGGSFSCGPNFQSNSPERPRGPFRSQLPSQSSLHGGGGWPSRRAGPVLHLVIPMTLSRGETSFSHTHTHTLTHSYIHTQFNSHNLKGKSWLLPPSMSTHTLATF